MADAGTLTDMKAFTLIADAAPAAAGAVHSGLIWISFRTLPHLSCSARMNAANSSRVEPIGRAPCEASRFCMKSDLMNRVISALSLLTIGSGVPAGAMTPNHSSAS